MKLDRLTISNSVHRYGHVLRRGDGVVLRRTLDIEVEGQREKERVKRTWERQVEEKSMEFGLRMEDALCRSKSSVGVRLLLDWGESGHPHLLGILPGFRHWSLSLP